MRGRVLDVGGKRKGKRGTFRPPLRAVEQWAYLNTDASTGPDYCCNAESIPLPDGSIDTIVMTELLEYLPRPKSVLRELYRISKTGAHVLVSTPLLHPIHGDHWADRARYAPVMLREMFEATGFNVCSIEPMGSVGAVIFDTLRVAFGYAGAKGGNRLLTRLLKATTEFFWWVDKISKKQKSHINTGYFSILTK